MILDLNVIFCDHTAISAFTSGVVGDIVDLGTEKRLGEGTPFYIYVTSGVEVTATGNPAIGITMETAEDKAFTAPVTHTLFVGLHKTDFGPAGAPLAAPCPFGTKRYARIKMTAASAIACADLSIGLAFGVQTNL
jgi:hypothetical protein